MPGYASVSVNLGDPIEVASLEFNKQRKLFIQDVPPITHEDVREFLGNFQAADIIISKRYQHVIITLKNPSDVDLALQQLSGVRIRGHTVQVQVYPRRMMLYISGIPSHYNRDKFIRFLSRYGDVETALVAVTPAGENKGFGYVEFAHNRVMLDLVREQIHGSTLEGRVLHCGLVPESVRSYCDTHSNQLYIETSAEFVSINISLHKEQSSLETYLLPDSRLLNIITCPDSISADNIWRDYISNQQTSSQSKPAAAELRYIVPGLSVGQLVNMLSNTQRKYPSIENSQEIHFLLLEMYPDDFELIEAIEKLLEQMKSKLGSQPITINMIINLVTLLKTESSPLECGTQPSHEYILRPRMSRSQAPTVVLPDMSLPPPTLAYPPPLMRPLHSSLRRTNSTAHQHMSVTTQRPAMVTRSRVRRQDTDSLIAMECSKRNHIQISSESSAPRNDCDFYSEQEMNKENLPYGLAYAHLCSSTGPITRQRKRTLEKALEIGPYSRTPGGKVRPNVTDKESDCRAVFETDLSTALQEVFKRSQSQTTPHASSKVLKRLLPDPEPSPENPSFIGQHSQGIGGHYAENYRSHLSDLRQVLW